MKTIRLSPIIRRITANNSNMFTGPGTNSYLLGDQEISIIDPGPALIDHIDDLISISGSYLKQIIITHTHPDHSPGASILKEKLGIPILGLTTESSLERDEPIDIDQQISHGDFIQTNEYTLEVIHTPGHASNHLCYLLKEENILFTGDHIMQGSTVVIAPPDGNMTEYLHSLNLLKEYNISKIAPGHGELIHDPIKIIDSIIEHRLGREKKVLEKLNKIGPSTIDELVIEVYDDVSAILHPIAKWSLEAHLIKLNENKKVAKNRQLYSVVE